MFCFLQMANEKPITTETVALTEKKMDMSLGLCVFFIFNLSLKAHHLCMIRVDAIIKMSKSNNTNVNKGKKLRASVSSLKLLNTNCDCDVSLLNH